MTKPIQTPKGIVEFPDDMSDEDITRALDDHFKPKLPQETLLGAGYEGLKGDVRTGAARVLHSFNMPEWAKHVEGQAAENYARQATRPLTDLDDDMLTGIYEQAAASLPSMAPVLAGGLTGASVGAIAGPAGSLAGSLIGGTAAALPQFFGSNLKRQKEEQNIPLDQTGMTAAGLTALGQSALDSLLGGGLFGGAFKVPAAAAKNIVSRMATKAIEGGLTEGLTEAAQQWLEVLQANPEKAYAMPPEVRKELRDSAIVGGAMGLLGGGASGVKGQGAQLSSPVAEEPPVQPPTPEPPYYPDGTGLPGQFEPDPGVMFPPGVEQPAPGEAPYLPNGTGLPNQVQPWAPDPNVFGLGAEAREAPWYPSDPRVTGLPGQQVPQPNPFVPDESVRGLGPETDLPWTPDKTGLPRPPGLPDPKPPFVPDPSVRGLGPETAPGQKVFRNIQQQLLAARQKQLDAGQKAFANPVQINAMARAWRERYETLAKQKGSDAFSEFAKENLSVQQVAETPVAEVKKALPKEAPKTEKRSWDGVPEEEFEVAKWEELRAQKARAARGESDPVADGHLKVWKKEYLKQRKAGERIEEAAKRANAVADAAAEGRTLKQDVILDPETRTANFKAWAKGAPVVESAASYKGGPGVFQVFHGTTHTGIDEINPKAGEMIGALGQGFYTTTNPEDASANYANRKGPDARYRADRLAEKYWIKDGMPWPEAQEKALSEILGSSEGAVMPVYVRMNNPLDTRKSGTSFTGREYTRLIKTINDLAATLPGTDVGPAVAIMNNQYENTGHVSARDAYDLLKKFGHFDANDRNPSPVPRAVERGYGQFFQDLAKRLGYDGLIEPAGQKYPSMNGMTKDTLHIVPFNGTQVKGKFNRGTYEETNRLMEQSAKGEIEILPNSAIIRLFKSADASTFMHESMHLWLEGMVRNAPHHRQIAHDVQALRDWTGNDGEPFTVAQHEQIARGFEQYLRTGKAPNKALADLFKQFAEWLVKIYKQATDIKTPDGKSVVVPDKIAKVYDRLFAIDDSVAEQGRSSPVGDGDPLPVSGQPQRHNQGAYNDNDRAAQEFNKTLQAQLGDNFRADAVPTQKGGGTYAHIRFNSKAKGWIPIGLSVRFSDHPQYYGHDKNIISIDNVTKNKPEDVIKIIKHYLRPEGAAPHIRLSFLDPKTQVHSTVVARYNADKARKGLDPFEYDKDKIKVVHDPRLFRQENGAFRRWFGASKVVDADGNPLTVYHGTSKDKDFGRFNVGRHGSWFTTDPEAASQYAMENDSQGYRYEGGRYEKTNTATRVMPVNLKIENPYTMTAADLKALNRDGSYKKIQSDFFDALRRQGYDGVKYPGGVWVVLKNPQQIKSIHNDGTYSNSPLILKQSGKADVDDLRPNMQRSNDNQNDRSWTPEFYQSMAKSYNIRAKAYDDRVEMWRGMAQKAMNDRRRAGRSGIGPKAQAALDAMEHWKQEAISARAQRDEYLTKGQALTSRTFQQAAQETPGQNPTSVYGTNQKSWRRIGKAVKAFFDPYSEVTNENAYRDMRNLLGGRVYAAEKSAQDSQKLFAKLTQPEKEAVNTYFDTPNANPLTIPASIRTETVALKNQINGPLKRALIDNNLLPADVAAKNDDSYLPRLYLKFLLESDGFKSTGAKLAKTYAKKRKEKTTDELLALGEIKDPGVRTFHALFRTQRDLAVLDFLNKVSQNEDWALPKSLVTWQGHKVTPQWLKDEADHIKQVRAPTERAMNPARADEMEALADRMRKTADEGMEALGREAYDNTQYRKLPDSYAYGPLRGMIVRNQIADDIIGTTEFVNPNNTWDKWFGDKNSKLTRGVSYWKMLKVPLNPPSQVRNVASNMILLHLSGVPIHKIGSTMYRAAQEMLKDGKYYQVAKKYGVGKGTFTEQELFAVSDELKKLDVSQQNGFAGWRAVWRGLLKVSKGMTDWHQRMEEWGKVAKIMDAMERQGMSENDAVREANKWLFDYSEAVTSIKRIRQSPLGMPFITFQYKMAPLLMEIMTKHPTRLLPYIALAYTVPALVAASNDIDEDDAEKLRKSLSAGLRRKNDMYLLPWKDADGRWQFIDVGYFMPWQMPVDMGRYAISGAYKAATGDARGGIKDAGEAIRAGGIMSNPVLNVTTALTTGIDAFTGRPIADKRDPAEKQVADVVSYAWSLVAPSLLSGYGAAGQLLNKESGTGMNRYGEPTTTYGQIAARALGANVYPIVPEAQRARNIQLMQHEIQDVKARMTSSLKDRSLTPAKRRDIMDNFREELVERNKELAKYVRESAASPRLAAATARP